MWCAFVARYPNQGVFQTAETNPQEQTSPSEMNPCGIGDELGLLVALLTPLITPRGFAPDPEDLKWSQYLCLPGCG